MLNITGSVKRISDISGNIGEKKSVTGNVARPETVYVRELDFKSRFEFPSVGDGQTLYIATDENMIYRFDEIRLAYERLGSNWREIEMIEGV